MDEINEKFEAFKEDTNLQLEKLNCKIDLKVEEIHTKIEAAKNEIIKWLIAIALVVIGIALK